MACRDDSTCLVVLCEFVLDHLPRDWIAGEHFDHSLLIVGWKRGRTRPRCCCNRLRNEHLRVIIEPDVRQLAVQPFAADAGGEANLCEDPEELFGLDVLAFGQRSFKRVLKSDVIQLHPPGVFKSSYRPE